MVKTTYMIWIVIVIPKNLNPRYTNYLYIDIVITGYFYTSNKQFAIQWRIERS